MASETASATIETKFTGNDEDQTNSSIATQLGRDTPPEAATEKVEGPSKPSKEFTFQSCLQIVGAFMLLFNSWGYLNLFGVFQNYYKTVLIPESSDSEISWIGSMLAFLLLLVSAFVGRLFDAGYLRSSIFAGSILLVFSTCMTSLGTKWYQLFLAQGVGSGIAVGILFTPAVACVSTWFKRHRNAALGIVISGSSIGAVVYPIAVEQLIPQIGFGWTVRVVALIQLVTLAIPTLVMKSRLPPRGVGPLIEPSAFRQPSYTIYTIGAFFAFWGLYTPFFYAPSYLQTLDSSSNIIPYIISMMNATSVLGRTLPNFVADVTGPLNVLVPTSVVAGILLFGWLGVNTWRGFVVFALLYGFFTGTLVSLPPAVVVSLTDPHDLNKIGVRMGMSFSIVSISLLTGTPIAGALISRDGGGFTFAIVFSAVSMFVGAALLFVARFVRTGRKLMVKV